MREGSYRIKERSVTVSEFEAGLEGALVGLLSDPGRWILIADVLSSNGRYLQFLAREDGLLRAEVSSNASLRGEDRLSAEQMVSLIEHGWREPVDASLPNFWRDADARSVGALAAAPGWVLRQVFGLEATDELVIRMFRSELDDPPARVPVEP